jgi:hypothetical protein
MADFGELCPLFTTGIFHEVVFPPPMHLTSLGTGINLLFGSANASNGGNNSSAFTFGRTVVITEAFIIRELTNKTTETDVWLFHKMSATLANNVASATCISTCTLPVSGSSFQPPGLKPFVAFHGKTFMSNDVLALVMASVNTANMETGSIGLMVRYKDK